jgi:hypothetical protein
MIQRDGSGAPMSGKDDEADVMARLRQALRRRNPRRSQLSDWMWRNHDSFADLLAEVPPDWEAVTEVFTGLGFRTAPGEPLTPERVRKTWWRVRRQYATAQTGQKPRASAKPAVEPSVAMPEPEEPRQPQPEADRPEPGPPETNRDTARDAIARLRAEMDKRSGRT